MTITKLSILLVDDHQLIRDAWRVFLNGIPAFQVIAETDNGEDAITLAKTKRPAIILMDLNMLPMSGFEAAAQIHKDVPASRIIGISMYMMPAYAKKLLSLGAMGYLTKNCSFDEVVEAILEVSKGKRYISSDIKDKIADQLFDKSDDPMTIKNLSKRELEVATLVMQGMSSKDISEHIHISLKTVEVHRYNILRKLKLKNSAELVSFLHNQGI